MQDLKGSITFGELAEMYLAYAKVNKKSWKRDVSSFKKLLPVFENMTGRSLYLSICLILL